MLMLRVVGRLSETLIKLTAAGMTTLTTPGLTTLTLTTPGLTTV